MRSTVVEVALFGQKGMRKTNPRGDVEAQSPVGCGNTIPGDVAETRGFAFMVPKAKKV